MYRWLVHVERKDMREWEVNVSLPGQRGRSYIYWNSETTDVDKDLDWTTPSTVETWYCTDEAAAKALALKISTEVVGRNVNVYQLVQVARCQPSAPIITPYTEKGLIPE